MNTWHIFAFESLLRVPDQPKLHIEELFSIARRNHTLYELDTFAITGAVETFPFTLFTEPQLFINLFPSTLLDNLISYKHQAFDLGWINNKGIYNSLDKKLENAKKHLKKDKTKQAINMLNAFINQVEAQNGEHLTSEAYALLKYNAEYLIKKLEE